MSIFRHFLEKNTTEELLVATGLALFVFVVLYVAKTLLHKKLLQWSKRNALRYDNLLANVVAATHKLMLGAVSLLVGLNTLELPSRLETIANRGFILILLIQVGMWGHQAICNWRKLRVQLSQDAEDGAASINYGVITFLAEIGLWSILSLMVLDNLGFNITTLVASLGIGGIAVALAVQNVLGDLFASLSIALDKPFYVGDFVVVDDLMGTVRHVGLKTTRIQSLSGEELIFSNADLLKSRIRNYKRMAERRVVFQVGVIFGTPPEKLKYANALISEIIQSQSDVRLDRSHLKAIGTSSLDFEAVYYVLDPDYLKYMNIQQAINLALIERFQENDIQFAFETHTLHIASLPNK